MSALFMFGCAVVSAVPFGMVALNLSRYRRLPRTALAQPPSVSVLIPARNEEANIGAALDSITRCTGVEWEVLVWDDASTDRTRDIVEQAAARDARVRLLGGVEPPAGWAGKPHACQRLGEAARGEILLFLDSDVRLRGTDALARIASAFERRELDLLSGVPLERVETLLERLIVPLIHFVLLGFLPLKRMRASADPRFAAACGQLMAFRRSSYLALGGHGLARGSFHEGIVLSRAWRRAGRTTDLFDASDLAECRMYGSAGEVWRGFAKNAHEGLASPSAVLPMSVLLLLGHVVPALALMTGSLQGAEAAWAGLAVLLGMGARGMLAARFSQPWMGVLLHPVGILILLLNQWYGALRNALGVPVGWRGRSVAAGAFLAVCVATVSAQPPVQSFPAAQMEDQNGRVHSLSFPSARPILCVIANRSGTAAIPGWVRPVRAHFGDRIEISGIADVRGIPAPLRPAVRGAIRRDLERNRSEWPVLMDWDGEVVSKVFNGAKATEVLVINPKGEIVLRASGEAGPDALGEIRKVLEGILQPSPAAKK